MSGRLSAARALGDALARQIPKELTGVDASRRYPRRSRATEEDDHRRMQPQPRHLHEQLDDLEIQIFPTCPLTTIPIPHRLGPPHAAPDD